MGVNEFVEGRVAVASFTITAQSVASTVTSDVYIPTGAIVTGVSLMCPGTLSVADMSQSFQIYAGAIPLVVATTVKGMPAQTVVSRHVLSTTAGNYISTAGQLNLTYGSWTGTSLGYAAPVVSVGYIV
jgi:hypothetical protein